MEVGYFTPFKQPEPPRLPKTEAEALMYSIRQGYSQLFMHIESGAILIFYAISFNSSFSPGGIEHTIRYELIGEHSPGAMYGSMQGNPLVYGMEWLGEYAHTNDPFA